MQIEIIIPGMLRDCVGGKSSFFVDATTITDALRIIQRDYPLLRVHVWDDAGSLRQHVLIFYNDTGIRWMPSLDVPLKAGDRLQIVQAISGGCGIHTPRPCKKPRRHGDTEMRTTKKSLRASVPPCLRVSVVNIYLRRESFSGRLP